MLIPCCWEKASDLARKPDGEEIPVCTWGYGNDAAAARRMAEARLARVLERVRQGEPFPDRYAYDDRPAREEVLETIDDGEDGEPFAVVTRNGYGARILNTARLMFLDIDVEPRTERSGFLRDLLRVFLGKAEEEEKSAKLARLDELRASLRELDIGTFRIYETRAGLRAVAIDRGFDPGAEATALHMRSVGADPRYARLCRIQKSFRARLDPKPWRCAASTPPGRFPREGEELRAAFLDWLADYERRAARHATCRYVETVGSGEASPEAALLVKLHDGLTRAHENLELA